MHLERWTIDEMTDESATLLISVYGSEYEPLPADAAWEVVGERLMGAERELVGGVWSEEQNFVMDREALEAFVQGAVEAGQREGLPGPRPLREGDVYWVFTDEAPQELHASWEEQVASTIEARGERSPEQAFAGVTGGFLARYEQPYAWDVTVAARQAAKGRYYRAIEMGRKKQAEE